MISLEQIRTLESKVNQAVSLLAGLQEENQQLKAKLAQAKSRIEELEFTVEEFREDQAEIEQGIMSALQHLDHLENAVGVLKPASQPVSVQDTIAETEQPAPQAVIEPAPSVEPVRFQPAAEPELEDEAEEETMPDPVVEPSAWTAPAQQFQPPLPASVESYETAEAEEEPEDEPAPNREPQLDIF